MDDLKSEFVTQLWQRRGAFWEAVSAMRGRWNVSPKVGLPDNPKKLKILALPPPGMGRRDTPEKKRIDARWRRELSEIAEAVVPVALLERDHSYSMGFGAPEWEPFMSACVLFDPPDTELERFAELGPFLATSLTGSGAVAMAVSPVKQLHDTHEERRVYMKAWSQTFSALFDLYLKPLGLDIDDVWEEIHKARPDIRENMDLELHGLRLRTYIEVDENITWDDVKTAFKMIDRGREERPKTGRPRRDRLRCVQCAILHDRHGWTYEQIAERYGWLDHTLAGKYIADGRRVLEEG